MVLGVVGPLDVNTDEPGEPGTFDAHNRPFLFPASRRRDADNAEQIEGFISRWEYRGHSSYDIKSITVTGESVGRMRCVSTDGSSVHSWLEFSDESSVKTARGEHGMINAMAFIPHLNVVVAASGDSLIVFNARTMRRLATLSTWKKVLLQLHYNHARDEVISGGSDGIFVWRLASIACELYAPEVVPFELTLLHGFRGCSQWAGKMIFDERSQVVITIDSMKVQTHDAAATTNLHTINKAHESPVTVALWVGEIENIVTGCMGGLLKIWACQHTSANEGKQGRRGRRQKKKHRRFRSRRRGLGQSPALVKSFEGHSGAITGLVRHCSNSSCVVSSGADGNLRIWDVDRLVPIITVRSPRAVASLWAFSGPGGQFRLVCAGAEGSIRTMVFRQVCQPLSFDTNGAWNLRYFPPVGESGEEGRRLPAVEKNDDPSQVGLILVQMKHGRWGLISESLLLPPNTKPPANAKTLLPNTTPSTCFTQADQAPSRIAGRRDTFGYTASTFSDQGKGGEAGTLGKGNTTSSLFHVWSPLSCVVQRYSHHELSRRRRKVICLADSGVLDTYLFGNAKGEASKIFSREIDLQTDGATATSLCLLPDTPACISASLERLLQSFSSKGAPIGGDTIATAGDGEDYEGRLCSRAERWKKARQVVGEKADQVVAIGTSHGDVILVETVISGTTLDVLEGVFASKVVQMAFCCASTDDAVRIGKTTPPAKNGRLICVGYDTSGMVALKGLAIISLTETFCLRLIEVPTYVRVASRSPFLAAGYTDGALNAFNLGEERINEFENGQLIGAHTTKITTISFSMRYRCMATGSVDGHIIIWDLDGQQLHTIHLQSPALAVEFMEISGELLVSFASGLSRIPPCGWCPLKLLIANERAARRAVVRSSTNSSSNIRLREGEAEVVIPGDSTLSARRRPADQEARNGAAGPRLACREGVKALKNSADGSSEMKQSAVMHITLAENSNGKPDKPSGEIAELGRTPQEVAGVRFRLNCRRTTTNGVTHGAEAPGSAKHGGHNNTSILDIMDAKFSTMSTLSPPPKVHAMKRSTRVLRSTLPAFPPSSVEHLRDETTPGQPATGDESVQEGERSGIVPVPAPVTLLTRGPHPQAGETPSVLKSTPSEGGVVVDAPVDGGTGDGMPTESEEGSQHEEAVLGNDVVVSRSATAVRTAFCAEVAKTSTLATAGSSSASLFSRLTGSLFDVVPRAPGMPAMPLSSTRRRRCTVPEGKGLHGGEVVVDKIVGHIDASAGGRQRPTNAQSTSSTHRLPKDATPMTSCPTQRPTTVSAAFTPGRASPRSFIARELTVQKPAAGLESAEAEQDVHAAREECEHEKFTTEEESRTGAMTEESPRSLPGGLRICPAACHVQENPACDPSSSEKKSSLMTIRRYRILGREQQPCPIPPSALPSGGISVETVAAVATEDVQNVVSPISTPRAMMKPLLDEDLVSLVSRSTLPPTPPLPSISGCRAFGVISPLSWSVNSGDCCRPSSSVGAQEGKARRHEHPKKPRMAPNNTVSPIPSGNSSFFPVRYRAGRRIPVIVRGRERAAPQS